MVPGTSHGVGDNQSFGERAAVMRTRRADREQFVAAAREKHGIVAHMPTHHAAIGNITNRHAAREIRPFRLGLLSHEVRNGRSLSPLDESAPRWRMGRERTTNSFDLFRFHFLSASSKPKGAACTAPFVG